MIVKIAPLPATAIAMTNAPAALTAHYAAELESIQSQGLFKSERIITGPQSAQITLADGRAAC
ncbi:hypothetical protein Xcc1_32910 [Xanthomonas campestris pv. campestris]|nr:hypothetical protein Xcc1_32910 [Xanthomonas campestris pv. campestris]